MAKMSELMIDIEERLRNNETPGSIAWVLGVPYEWVKQIQYAMDFVPENDAFETCNFVGEE